MERDRLLDLERERPDEMGPKPLLIGLLDLDRELDLVLDRGDLDLDLDLERDLEYDLERDLDLAQEE